MLNSDAEGLHLRKAHTVIIANEFLLPNLTNERHCKIYLFIALFEESNSRDRIILVHYRIEVEDRSQMEVLQFILKVDIAFDASFFDLIDEIIKFDARVVDFLIHVYVFNTIALIWQQEEPTFYDIRLSAVSLFWGVNRRVTVPGHYLVSTESQKIVGVLIGCMGEGIDPVKIEIVLFRMNANKSLAHWVAVVPKSSFFFPNEFVIEELLLSLSYLD